MAHQAIGRIALRLPDGADPTTAKVVRSFGGESTSSTARFEGAYALVENVVVGERIDLRFGLRQYETIERAAGNEYRVRWKGSVVTHLDPPGAKVPLYRDRAGLREDQAPMCSPRFP